MQYVEAKTIITKAKSSHWFGIDYNMNIYRGCSHGCIYCDSRSDCYHNPDFDTVKVKSHAIDIITANLRSKRAKGVIGTGAMSDPYNELEKQLLLTRQALQLIDKYRFGVGITTKSPLIVRDADILKAIAKHSPLICKLTITTYDDDLCKVIEPNVASTSQRFEAIAELAQKEIYCGILLMPLLPFINDNSLNVLSILRKAKECGAKFVYPGFGVTLRDNQRQYFYDRLDERFPNIKQIYINTFGDRYVCHQPSANTLFREFETEARRLGILCRMEDIIKDYKFRYQTNNSIHQQELF